MNLLRKFKKSDDFEKMAALVSGMRNTLLMWEQEERQKVNPQQWQEFILSIIENMEEDGHWTVALEEDSLPPDELVEFTTLPSAVALSALALDLQSDSPNENSFSAFQEGSVAFQLKGFGEDHLFQVCEILMIFNEGKLPVYLAEHQENALFGPLKEWKQILVDRLKQGNTQLPFGGDYREIFAQILVGMEGLS